jgi:hypothetical protein
MTRVRIAAGESYDLASTAEMNAHFERLDRRFAEETREKVRGIKLMRLPVSYAQATGISLTLPVTSGGYGLIGPESGFIWRVARITVASNGADNGKAGTPGSAVSLYTTSDETEQQKNLIDSTLQLGQAYYPSSRGLWIMPGEGIQAVIVSVASNTYTMTGQVISVPAEMVGKIV